MYMKYFRIELKDGESFIDNAETHLGIIKKHDLATREHISTRVVELEGEQLAIAISNEQSDE